MKNYGNQQTQTKTNEMQFRQSHRYFNNIREIRKKKLKLTKNGKSPGEKNINLELYTYAPEQFKMRLLHFFK
jgi:hypothetical protein